jgi:hypothetical protein
MPEARSTRPPGDVDVFPDLDPDSTRATFLVPVNPSMACPAAVCLSHAVPSALVGAPCCAAGAGGTVPQAGTTELRCHHLVLGGQAIEIRRFEPTRLPVQPSPSAPPTK